MTHEELFNEHNLNLTDCVTLMRLLVQGLLNPKQHLTVLPLKHKEKGVWHAILVVVHKNDGGDTELIPLARLLPGDELYEYEMPQGSDLQVYDEIVTHQFAKKTYEARVVKGQEPGGTIPVILNRGGKD